MLPVNPFQSNQFPVSQPFTAQSFTSQPPMRTAPSVSGMETTQVANVVLQQPQHDFVKAGSNLNEQERKYCRCLLEVESKGRAYSPYGVCTKSVGAQVHSCSPHYDWGLMDLDMLLAYASLHKIDTSGVNSREQALQLISQWKGSKAEAM